MLHRRYTMIVATSTLVFVCMMLHAQTRGQSLHPAAYTDAEVYRIYQALLPADGLQAGYSESAGSFILLSPQAFHADTTLAVASIGDSCGSRCFHVLETKDGVWKNLSWKGTSCAWAS